MTGAQLANYGKVSFRGYMSVMSERIWLDNISITAKEISSSVDELAAKQQITAVKGGISIEGFEGQQVRVFTVDGRQVDAFVADGHRSLSMSPGIYIVTVGKQAYKVSVK